MPDEKFLFGDGVEQADLDALNEALSTARTQPAAGEYLLSARTGLGGACRSSDRHLRW